jgi:DNA mismatch repair protein MutL
VTTSNDVIDETTGETTTVKTTTYYAGALAGYLSTNKTYTVTVSDTTYINDNGLDNLFNVAGTLKTAADYATYTPAAYSEAPLTDGTLYARLNAYAAANGQMPWAQGENAPELLVTQVKLHGANLELTGNLTMNLRMKADQLPAGFTYSNVKLVANGTEYVGVDEGEYYTFAVKDIPAAEMGKDRAYYIVVEMKNGGKSYLRVTDDGCGIPADQVETAFLRHATSKISTVHDLDAIGTLGFRGEALASIGAVSRTEILTKTRDSKTGTRVLFHGGEVLTHEQTGCPDGTTLIVTDLFYNTPARLKFLKSDSAESGMIIDFMSQMALAYKDIKFRLINNGNVLFATNGDGNRFNTIVRVYKNVDPKNLTAVNYEEGKLKLEGYISTPAQSKNSRSSQIFFVNGRVVHSKVMEKGLMEGYRERIFEGRHPVAYLFLETDPADLDVNIHPNKREVRFDKEADIIDFMTRAIRSCLSTEAAMVSGTSLFKENTAELKEEAKKEKQVDIKSFLSTKAKEDMKSDDIEVVKKAQEELSKVSNEVFSKLYQQAQNQGATVNDDNVVDAEEV